MGVDAKGGAVPTAKKRLDAGCSVRSVPTESNTGKRAVTEHVRHLMLGDFGHHEWYDSI